MSGAATPSVKGRGKVLKYEGMRLYELLPHTADVRVRVRASTRAGLIAASLQGMFAAAEPKLGAAEETERPFSIDAPDFAQLLVGFLNDALQKAAANGETYEDVRISLITDKKLQGAFIGRPATGFATPIAAATDKELKVEKNENGEWETTITFEK